MQNIYRLIGKKVLLLSLVIFTAGGASVYGQEVNSDVRVTDLGIVVDDYGNPIPNVKIQKKGSDVISSSNEKGQFELDAKEGDVFIFSHPDFYERIIHVTPGMAMDAGTEFQLVGKYLERPTQLDVLYGVNDKDEFLGAASTIYNNELSSTLSNTIIGSLAGRLPGLYVEQHHGFRSPSTSANASLDLIGWVPVTGQAMPSDNTQYYLNARGMSPVTVVDGIQRELYSLDPEDIESVSIQRDALSSILLGMRSSRGVLLITTKKPTKGKFQLSFTGRYGVQSAINLPDALPAYQYAYLLNEALQNDGKSAAYTSGDFEVFRNGTNSVSHPDNDWYKIALKENAPIQSYNLNVTGGSKSASYYVSLGYFNQEGLFRTSSMNSYNTNLSLDRYLISSKLDIDVTKEFNIGVTIIGRIEEGNQPGAGYSNILSDIYRTPNSAYPVYNPDGSYGGNVSFSNNILSQTTNSGYIADESRDIMANLNLKYDLTRFAKGLSATLKTNISSQNKGATQRNKRSLVYEYTPSEDGSGGAYDLFGVLSPQTNNFIPVSNATFWYGQLALNYERKIGEHNIDVSAVGDMQNILVNYDLPMRPANITGKAKYNYAQKYFVEAAINESYFNRYMPGKQWGTFYAAGLGWDIKKEAFLSDTNWLDQLKLRTVFGHTGNGMENSGYYLWRQTYRQSVTDYTYPQGYAQGLGQATIDNAPLANENISWEKAYKLNVGADISMFENHLTVTADYYRDKYYDLLQIRGKDIALLGFAYPAENIGKKLFKGGEVSITYQNNVGGFNYFITANWGINASEVLFIDEQYKQEEYNKVTGKPNGAIFGLEADGFFNSTEEIEQSAVIEGFNILPGDIKYKDLNGDGVVNQYDQTVIGSDKPLSYYGLTTGFNYAGFDFHVLFQGAYNRDLYLGENTLMAGFQGYRQSYGQAYSHMINRWTPETKETAEYPRLSAGGNTYNMSPNGWVTSFWVKSGDYFRVKDIYLAYTLPSSICDHYFGGTKVKFFASAQNLFTKAACDMVDPEITNFGNYPAQRVFNTGVNIKF